MKHPGVWIFTALVLGTVVGGVTSSGDDTKVDFIEVPHTKIIHDPTPDPVEVPVLPKACQLAIDLAGDITRAAENIYSSGDEQLEILRDARVIAAGGYDATEIDRRQRDLHGQTVGDLYDLEEAFAQYDPAKKECEKADD